MNNTQILLLCVLMLTARSCRTTEDRFVTKW